MPRREIIRVDQKLCDGCGECVVACAEGAIEIRDGVAHLVSTSYCDGLGACLGHCPQGAITMVEAEAESFDEEAVRRRLEEERPVPFSRPFPVHGEPAPGGGGCPGSRPISLPSPAAGRVSAVGEAAGAPSALRHWPIQLHLLSPSAPGLEDADLLLAADCVAYSVGGFHRRFLAGRALAIACPKLDSQQEIYVDKLAQMIDGAGLRSLDLMIMEVPCCGGLVRLAEEACRRASRKIPVRFTVVSVGGVVLGVHPLVRSA